MSPAGHSWGRFPQASHTVISVIDRHRPLPARDRAMLPYGNGRSYGDSCLNDGGALLYTKALDHFIEFNPESGELECEAGVQLADILDLVVPQGWFVPVTPGTRFITCWRSSCCARMAVAACAAQRKTPNGSPPQSVGWG
jgi:FAD/FMN-containing dehydrogenase